MGIPQFQDGQLSELKVHWALRGSLLLNLVSACCIAPCLHGNMTLKNRCECALTGYVLLDLYALLAKDQCSQMSLPTGSTFLAAQTAWNLQGVALSMIVVC